MNKLLKAKIIEKYGSQFEFSRVLKAHESDVSRVVRGRKVLTQKDLKKWADALDVSKEFLKKEGK